MANLRPEVFKARVMELGLGDVLPYLHGCHINTLAKFAYGSSSNPSANDMEEVE